MTPHILQEENRSFFDFPDFLEDEAHVVPAALRSRLGAFERRMGITLINRLHGLTTTATSWQRHVRSRSRYKNQGR